MTQPVTPSPLILGSPIVFQKPKDLEAINLRLSPPSSRENYAWQAQERGIIDAEGNLKRASFTLSLESTPPIEISQTLQDEGSWSWNWYDFFTYVTSYFTKTFKGTQVELREGVYRFLNRGIWKSQLEKICPSDVINNFVTEEMWGFCDQAPDVLEMAILFPPQFMEELTKENFEKFHQFAIYLISIQKASVRPSSFQKALTEFASLSCDTVPEEKKERHNFLKTAMEQTRASTHSFFSSEKEAPFSSLTFLQDGSISFKIVWGLSSQKQSASPLEDFRLNMEWNGEKLKYTLLSSKSHPAEALHDRLLHRLPLTSDPKILGTYWAYLTLGGALFNQKEAEKQGTEILKKHGMPAILAAFQEGKRSLPQGPEILAAYYCNMVHFLKAQGIAMTQIPELALTPKQKQQLDQNPLGTVLIQNKPLLPATLQLLGILHARQTPSFLCHLTASHLQIRWQGLHLVLPYDLKRIEEEIELALQNDPEKFLLGISQILTTFLCLLREIVVNNEGMKIDILEVVYQKMRKDPRFYPTALYLDMLLHGKYADAAAILDLPSVLSAAVQEQKLTSVLSLLDILFAKGPYAELFSKIKDSILAHPENTYQAALEPLLVCQDPHIFPQAWKFYATFPCSSFFFSIASTLHTILLPSALSHLRQLFLSSTNPLKASERVELLTAYLLRLIEKEPSLFPSYGPQLLRLMAPLIKTGAYDRLSAVKLLQNIIEKFPIYLREIYPLIEELQPTQEEVPDLLDHLLEQIPSALNLATQDVKRALPLFAVYKDRRIVEKIQKMVEDASKPERLADLLESLKNEPFFLEDYVSIMEKLATYKNPPLPCFKKKLTKIEPLLTPSQKNRLALAYAIIIKQEQTIIHALPSLEWLFDQLQNANEFPTYFLLFLSLTPRHKIDPSKALWIAEQLQATDDTRTFFAYLLRQNQNDLSSERWKKALQHLIATFPRLQETRPLLQLWGKVVTKEEKSLFNDCWNLYNKKAFDEMSARLNGSKKNQKVEASNEYVHALLSSSPLTPEDLKKAFSLLKKLPSPTNDLWALFFKHLVDSLDDELAKQAWQLWHQQHPVTAFSPDEELSWKRAICTCLSRPVSMQSEIAQFLQDDLKTLLLKATPEGCKSFTKIYMKICIAAFWPLEKTKTAKSVHTLHSILSDPVLIDKIGNPWQLLEKKHEIYFILLLTYQTDEAISLAAHRQFVLAITENELSNNNDPYIFKIYSLSPYFPKNAQDQKTLHDWIEANWKLQKQTLNWQMACSLIQHLCVFDYGFESVFKKWEEMAAEEWNSAETTTFAKKAISQVFPEKKSLSAPFLEVTCDVLTTLRRHHKIEQNPDLYLETIENKFKAFLIRHSPNESGLLEQFLIHFSLIYCQIGFKTPYMYKKTFKILEIILFYLRETSNEKGMQIIAEFATHLPLMLEFFSRNEDHEGLKSLQGNLNSMMEIPSIVIPNYLEPSSWGNILVQLCNTLSCTGHFALVEPFILKTFINCTNSNPIKNKNLSKTLVQISIPPFVTSFLIHPLKTLQSADLKKIIETLSNTQIELVLAILTKSATSHTIQCLNSLAAARIVRYMKVQNIHALSHLFDRDVAPFESTVPYDISIQFLLRAEWILAITSLLNTSLSDKLSASLRKRKIRLTQELTKFTLAHMTSIIHYDVDIQLLIQIMRDDKDVVTAMFGAFQIPEHLPPEVVAKLQTFRTFLENKVKKLT